MIPTAVVFAEIIFFYYYYLLCTLFNCHQIPISGNFAQTHCCEERHFGVVDIWSCSTDTAGPKKCANLLLTVLPVKWWKRVRWSSLNFGVIPKKIYNLQFHIALRAADCRDTQIMSALQHWGVFYKLLPIVTLYLKSMRTVSVWMTALVFSVAEACWKWTTTLKNWKRVNTNCVEEQASCKAMAWSFGQQR